MMFNWFNKKKSTLPAPDPAPQGRQRSEELRTQGNLRLDEGRLEEAAMLYAEAASADASNAKALINLGFVRAEQGRSDEARDALTRAIKLDPWLHDAHYLLGNLAKARGEVPQAVEHYQQALAVKRDFAECRRDLCLLLAQSGQTAEARAVLGGGEAFSAASPDLYFFRGTLHLVDNEFPEAITEFSEAARLDPLNPAPLTNLGLAQFKQGDVFAAIENYRQVLELQPDNVRAHCNLGGAYQIRGRLDLAAESYARAIEIDPDYIAAYHNRLYALSFDERCSPEAYLREARHAGAWMSAHARPYTHWLSDGEPATDRPLRIGFVSGDLRNHPVGAFLEGVVSCIDPARLTLVAYSTRPRGDQLTERIKRSFAHWHVVDALSDEQLAQKIHADRIDILVDLAGHTAYNRLPVFAWRPAPVQVAWLGFFASTGVAEMDYILVDPVSVPPAGREFLSEQPWYVPQTRLCFTPPLTGRPLGVSELPALRNGHVTFGSFQIFSKLSGSALSTWARVLEQVPGSRLRLQSWQLGYEGARKDLLQRLGAVGVSADRVTLHGGSPRDDYLEAHGEVDIILDTFPFPGGTTTAEALWMGVPTVTRTGRTLLERQGESLLSCAGLGDWVAQDEQQFIAIAVARANDLPALAELRSQLRERVLASPLYDAKRFARHLERAFMDMWRTRAIG